ncbi:hypothetical protein L3X38_022007 [Prunus dulcis]|uniref:Isopenicillin N synthase-like Fe(2+) 2OG dioxygenase domain-containing protein n=1 Tax=Prunus dulcis TaxID=3755 RepID=A0AAD4Z3Z6_PRUDU|nr:hypothetical protein L3X38_022007 [Prunus dulcis]
MQLGSLSSTSLMELMVSKSKKMGFGMPVNFQKDAFVVNVGDSFEILSNGVYHSIEHRAMVNSEKERLSVAMFINPKFEAEIGPARSLITPQKPTTLQNSWDGESYLDQMKI